jgi:hypothetical protein
VTTRVVRTPLTDEWRVRRRWLPHREGVGVKVIGSRERAAVRIAIERASLCLHHQLLQHL